MVKMVVSSFYNTLINEEEAIPTSTMLEIERLRLKGIQLTVCTNRLYQDVLDYNKDFPFIDYIVSLNGSYVWDVGKKKCIFKNKIPKTSVKRIITAFTDNNIIYYNYNSVVANNQNIETQDLYKIEIELKNIQEQEKIKKINVNSSVFIDKGRIILEITSPKSNMFIGVNQILVKKGLKKEELIVIGCNESDESLIQNIPESYIVKNSCELLKKYPNKILDNHNTKGVENILKEL